MSRCQSIVWKSSYWPRPGISSTWKRISNVWRKGTYQAAYIAILPFNSPIWSWASRMCDVLEEKYQTWLHFLITGEACAIWTTQHARPQNSDKILGFEVQYWFNQVEWVRGVLVVLLLAINWRPLNWTISVATNEICWAHQEIIVRSACLSLVAGAGHSGRPLHLLPLLHQDQLQVINLHKAAPAQNRKSHAVHLEVWTNMQHIPWY